MSLILGLETSCDETAAAVVRDGRRVLSNVVATQHELHLRYAGVVPEIASRAHLQRLMPVVTEALEQAGVGWDQLDAIAVGNRPGLVGSLIVGVAAAKALAWSLGKPLLGVDHVRAHLHAAQLVDGPGTPLPAAPEYPALGLVVSGGHTTLYRLASADEIQRLGSTIDDAIGEAYDKAGVILDAGYPGGPAIDRLAQQSTADPEQLRPLPVSLLGGDSLDFSFSGLKTALLYAVRGHPRGRGKAATFERSVEDLTPDQRADLAAAFQRAAVSAVIAKLGREVDRRHARIQRAESRGSQLQPASRYRSLLLGGGVSANSHLRQQVRAFGQRQGLTVHLPAMAYCVDNAAMIAGYGQQLLTRGELAPLDLPVVATTRI